MRALGWGGTQQRVASAAAALACAAARMDRRAGAGPGAQPVHHGRNHDRADPCERRDPRRLDAAGRGDARVAHRRRARGRHGGRRPAADARHDRQPAQLRRLPGPAAHAARRGPRQLHADPLLRHDRRRLGRRRLRADLRRRIDPDRRRDVPGLVPGRPPRDRPAEQALDAHRAGRRAVLDLPRAGGDRRGQGARVGPAAAEHRGRPARGRLPDGPDARAGERRLAVQDAGPLGSRALRRRDRAAGDHARLRPGRAERQRRLVRGRRRDLAGRDRRGGRIRRRAGALPGRRRPRPAVLGRDRLRRRRRAHARVPRDRLRGQRRGVQVGRLQGRRARAVHRRAPQPGDRVRAGRLVRRRGRRRAHGARRPGLGRRREPVPARRRELDRLHGRDRRRPGRLARRRVPLHRRGRERRDRAQPPDPDRRHAAA